MKINFFTSLNFLNLSCLGSSLDQKDHENKNNSLTQRICSYVSGLFQWIASFFIDVKQQEQANEKKLFEGLEKEKKDLNPPILAQVEMKEDHFQEKKTTSFLFSVEDVQGDGNCLFHCLEQLLKKSDPLIKEDYASLRNKAVEWVIKRIEIEKEKETELERPTRMEIEYNIIVSLNEQIEDKIEKLRNPKKFVNGSNPTVLWGVDSIFSSVYQIWARIFEEDQEIFEELSQEKINEKIAELEKQKMTIDQYPNYIAQSGHFASGIEIRAIATLFNKPIILWTEIGTTLPENSSLTKEEYVDKMKQEFISPLLGDLSLGFSHIENEPKDKFYSPVVYFPFPDGLNTIEDIKTSQYRFEDGLHLLFFSRNHYKKLHVK